MLGCHPKLGGAPTKIGTHPHKRKEISKYGGWFHVAAEECYCVWTDCGRVGVEQHCVKALNKNDTALKGKKGTLNSAFRNDSLTKNYYATTRTTPTTSHKLPCSTRPPLFTQPVKFNNTGQLTSHKPRLQQLQLHRLSRCTNSISTTTNNNIP